MARVTRFGESTGRHEEHELPDDVYIVTDMDEEFGLGLPYGTLRTATTMEEEFGTSDPSVITGMDREFGTADDKIRRYRQRHAATHAPAADALRGALNPRAMSDTATDSIGSTALTPAKVVEREKAPQPAIGGLTGEAFKGLSETEQYARLQPGTVVYTLSETQGKIGFSYRPFVVTEPIANDILTVQALSVASDTGLLQRDNEERVFTISHLPNFFRDQGVVINNPALLAENISLCRLETTTTEYVRNNLEELAACNAVLLDTTNRGFANLYCFVSDAAGRVALAYRSKYGSFGTDSVRWPESTGIDYFRQEVLGKSGFADYTRYVNNVDRIVFPPAPTTS